MVQITFGNDIFQCLQDETVLDALIRENITIPFSCRRGVCGSCILRSLDSQPPKLAQSSLKVTQQHQNYFFACLCKPEQDMAIALTNQSGIFTEATVIDKRQLNTNFILLALKCKEALDYFPGQFINLRRFDGLIRSYSIASTADRPNYLELHIRKHTGGRFSEWVADELAIGEKLEISEPQGHCFYMPDHQDQGILLVATGSGLAPLTGILKDALTQGHHGPIHLFHGSRTIDGLYHIDEMRQLAKQHSNFKYTPCLSGANIPDGFSPGRVHEVAANTLTNLKQWRVYLCGNPNMVLQMQQRAFLNGASPQDIYTEAFHFTP